MSFFGLTSLGPQNSFLESSVHRPTLHLFTVDDLKDAFCKRSRSSDCGREGITIDQIPALLHSMHHGPASEMECQRLKNAVVQMFEKKHGKKPTSSKDEANCDKLTGIKEPGESEYFSISLCEKEWILWTLLKDAFLHVKSETEQYIKDLTSDPSDEYSKSRSGVNYKSYQQYRDATRRHARTRDGPSNALIKPLASSQEYGWSAENLHRVKRISHGRKSCPETVYASELVKSGIIF